MTVGPMKKPVVKLQLGVELDWPGLTSLSGGGAPWRVSAPRAVLRGPRIRLLLLELKAPGSEKAAGRGPRSVGCFPFKRRYNWAVTHLQLLICVAQLNRNLKPAQI